MKSLVLNMEICCDKGRQTVWIGTENGSGAEYPVECEGDIGKAVEQYIAEYYPEAVKAADIQETKETKVPGHTPVHAVVSWYSFDRPQVDLFGSDEEAVAYLKSTAEKELEIDVNENGWAAKLESDTDGGYAKLIADFGDHEDITEFSIPSLIIDHRENQNTEETDPVKERCRDCIYLAEEDNCEWICADWKKEVHEVPDEDCAAETPYRTWSYLIIDNNTSDVVKEDHGFETEEDAYEQAKAELGYANGLNVRIETYQS